MQTISAGGTNPTVKYYLPSFFRLSISEGKKGIFLTVVGMIDVEDHSSIDMDCITAVLEFLELVQYNLQYLQNSHCTVGYISQSLLESLQESKQESKQKKC